MRFAICCSILFAASFATADAPKTVTGDAARNMMRALKAAGLKSTASPKPAWKVAELFCQAKDSDDKLGSVSCTADGRKLADAAALAVQLGMAGAGIAEKYGMGGGRTNAYNLSCSDEQTTFTCSFATEPM